MKKTILTLSAILMLSACASVVAGGEEYAEIQGHFATPADYADEAKNHCAKYGRRAVLKDKTGLTRVYECKK
ncbi:MAG: lipoprotein [Alphaproteobacteria bacterium]